VNLFSGYLPNYSSCLPAQNAPKDCTTVPTGCLVP
jgi:hypothetical protein